MTDIIQQAEEHVRELAKTKLSANLFYHNLQHTEEVVAATWEIGKGENLSPDEMEILILSAWFHDIGYISIYIGHEEESQLIAEEFLRSKNYPEERIEKIKQCIIATKFMHIPGNLLESVLIDADRLSMGTPDFPKKGEMLRKEWEVYLGKKYTNYEWNKLQISYLNETKLLTTYARKKYLAQKDQNLKYFKEEGIRMEKAEQNIGANSRQWVSSIIRLIRSLAWSLMLGFSVGLTLSIVVWGVHWFSITIGAISGLFIGAVLKIADRPFEHRIIRRFSFPVSLIIGTFTLILLFKGSQFAAVFIYDLLFTGLSLRQITNAQLFLDIISLNSLLNMLWTAVMVSFILNFLKLTSRIIGPRMMRSYMVGKYHRPVQEERIFMFIDLNSSTTLAEKMRPVDYHRMLNRFFIDIAKPVRRYNGEIYQYVGDEVVVTWKMKEGVSEANCIRCYFRIVRQMKKQEQAYIREFGFMPEFKVGMHGGSVVTGEVGKNKTEIVFHGDVINTTERILNQCINLKKPMLISENLLRKIDFDPKIHAEYVTTALFRGKENEVSLYSLWREDK